MVGVRKPELLAWMGNDGILSVMGTRRVLGEGGECGCGYIESESSVVIQVEILRVLFGF